MGRYRLNYVIRRKSTVHRDTPNRNFLCVGDVEDLGVQPWGGGGMFARAQDGHTEGSFALIPHPETADRKAPPLAISAENG